MTAGETGPACVGATCPFCSHDNDFLFFMLDESPLESDEEVVKPVFSGGSICEHAFYLKAVWKDATDAPDAPPRVLRYLIPQIRNRKTELEQARKLAVTIKRLIPRRAEVRNVPIRPLGTPVNNLEQVTTCLELEGMATFHPNVADLLKARPGQGPAA